MTLSLGICLRIGCAVVRTALCTECCFNGWRCQEPLDKTSGQFQILSENTLPWVFKYSYTDRYAKHLEAPNQRPQMTTKPLAMRGHVNQCSRRSYSVVFSCYQGEKPMRRPSRTPNCRSRRFATRAPNKPLHALIQPCHFKLYYTNLLHVTSSKAQAFSRVSQGGNRSPVKSPCSTLSHPRHNVVISKKIYKMLPWRTEFLIRGSGNHGLA